MGMFDDKTTGNYVGGVAQSIDMRDPRVAMVVRRLQAQGIAPTRANIAEALAVMTPGAPAQAGMLERTQRAYGQRMADPNSAEGRAEAKGRAAQGSTKGLTDEQKRRFGIK